VKRTGKCESVEDVIYIRMGTTQGISLCSYLYLKLAKYHVSLLSFMCFLLQNRRIGGQNRFWMGKVLGKVEGGRIWCKQCIHMHVTAAGIRGR
jgi:hypothetical protein